MGVTFKMSHAVDVMSQSDAVVAFAERAVNLHGATIARELDAFSAMRHANADSWARLCLIKAILSPGANLDVNIRAAKAVYDRMMTGFTARTFDDIAAILKTVRYGCLPFPNNVRSLLQSWETIATLTSDMMTWDSLTALVKVGKLAGLGDKTRSWALALYDGSSRVFTLDRHMIRGLASITDVYLSDNPKDDVSTATGTYRALAEFMLLIVERYFMCDPLIVQWSMWNELRHAGEHASHIELAR